MDQKNLTVEGLKTFFHSPEGQDEIFAFTEMLRVKVGSPEKYLETINAAEDEVEGLDITTILRQLHLMFEPFYNAMPTGHDKGHAVRDLLAALALTANDPFVSTGYKSDVFAGMIGGGWHDFANSFVVRYQDYALRAGHGEAAAFAFFHLADILLPFNLRLLATYNILVHTHYLKPVTVKDPPGFVREPYWYGLNYTEDSKPYGMGVLLTRFADRLDTNGITLAVRELLAKGDAVSNGGGTDITADQWYNITGESLNASFQPQIAMMETSKGKAPTLLKHMLNYGFSNFGLSVYSQDDHKFRTMVELITEKMHQVMTLRDVVTTAGSVRTEAKKEELQNLLRRVSLSDDEAFEKSWEVIEQVWDNLNPTVRKHWKPGITYLNKAYNHWINQLADTAKTNPDYADLVDELREELLS